MREIARTCREAVGRGQIVERGGKVERRAISRFDLDCEKARSALGFVPKIDLISGLAELVRTGV